MECFKRYKLKGEYSKNYKINMVSVSSLVKTCVVRLYDLFRLDAQSEMLIYIYKHFVPDVDYSLKSLKC